MNIHQRGGAVVLLKSFIRFDDCSLVVGGVYARVALFLLYSCRAFYKIKSTRVCVCVCVARYASTRQNVMAVFLCGTCNKKNRMREKLLNC